MADSAWANEERKRRREVLNAAQLERLREIAADPKEELSDSLFSLDITGLEPLSVNDRETLTTYAGTAMTLQLFREPRVLTSGELSERLASSHRLAMELLEAQKSKAEDSTLDIGHASQWLKKALRALEVDVLLRRDPMAFRQI